MSYTPNPPWVDYPSEDTLVTAATLQHLEDGLAAAATVADTATTPAEVTAAISAAITAAAPVTSRTFSTTGTAVVATGAHRLYNDTGGTLTVTTVRAAVGTAPTGAALVVDVNKNGTTIFPTQANRPSIAAAGFTATGTPGVTGWAAGEYLTVDVDQVGSTVPGSDLTVTVTTTGPT